TRVSLDALDHRSQGQSEWVPMVARPAAVLLPIRLLMGWLAFVPPSVIDATARALAAAARTSLTSALVFLIIVGQLIGLVYLALLGVLNPVAVAERRDLPTTVIRTMRLMARGRWSYLLLVFLVFGTISGAPRAALSFFARPTHLASTDYRLQLATLFEVVVRLGVLVFTAAYYRELCRATDGAVPGDIAATFD
ncbi:MAG TPA: hypothetical protein VFE03_08550, partial [Caulobacteraceae bacterium]|nr:hypothetical protein [Caulobacteraceae bacterium]